MTDFEAVLQALVGSRVDFIIVGGAAATAHGSARLTNDLDIVYSRSRDNIARLVSALRAFNPYPRGAPAGLPFRFDEETIRAGLNFTFTTTAGDLDILGEIAGGGGYEGLLSSSIRIQLYGIECLCLGLDRLIEVKRAAGRSKDLEAIAELEALREERFTE
jgi:predicted nucleotidyltransferase